MDSVVCNKVQPVVRKVKKKQVKGELDRLKQAEKKKRRLEKALATSAAIRSELEKKKQNKKEEQQRLDEEGAAIAEAVALQVLLGEDSDDSRKILLNEEEGFKHWGCAGKLDLFTDNSRPCLSHEDGSRYKLEEIGWVSDPYETGFRWGEVGNSDWPFSCGSLGRDVHTPYCAGEVWGTTDFSAGLMAAQAVSSLQIAEDAPVDTIVVNGMLRR